MKKMTHVRPDGDYQTFARIRGDECKVEPLRQESGMVNDAAGPQSGQKAHTRRRTLGNVSYVVTYMYSYAVKQLYFGDGRG